MKKFSTTNTGRDSRRNMHVGTGMSAKHTTKIRKFSQLILMILHITLVAFSSSDTVAETRHHEAHEHGVAHLNVAVEGKELILEFVSPAANIVGFEYSPATSEEMKTFQKAIQTLEDGDAAIHLPAAAEGELHYSAVQTDFDSVLDRHQTDVHAHSHRVETHQADPHGNAHNGDQPEQHHSHAVHSDFRATYQFRIGQPNKLQYLDIQLLKLFPAIEHLEIQLLTPSRQTALELTAGNSRIDL